MPKADNFISHKYLDLSNGFLAKTQVALAVDIHSLQTCCFYPLYVIQAHRLHQNQSRHQPYLKRFSGAFALKPPYPPLDQFLSMMFFLLEATLL
jgi:hypothetical protein